MADEFEDYYALLEIPPDADEATIRLAFRKLARLYHPDVGGTGSLSRMQKLNIAYQTLSNPEQRQAYDARRQALTGQAVPTPSAPPPSAASTPGTPRRGPRSGSRHHSSGPLHRIAALEAQDDTAVVAVAFTRSGTQVGMGLIDGRVLMWDVTSRRLAVTLSFGPGAGAGVLQDLRLSADGTHAVAWGFQLGTRIWQVSDGRTLWNAGTSGPSGTMDAVLLDAPAVIRLALPDAPLALAEEDPFRWAHLGRRGTAVFARPLRGPVDPTWAIPLRCPEGTGGGLFSDPPDAHWRVHQRYLSADGRRLLTYSTGRTSRLPTARVLHIWELDRRTLLGASQSRRMVRVAEAIETLSFPLATTPDFSRVAINRQGEGVNIYTPGKGDQKVIATGAVPQDARIALSENGAYLAIARGARLDLWEVHDGRHVEEWQFTTEVTALAFAAQMTRPLLGVGLRNGIVELWG